MTRLQIHDRAGYGFDMAGFSQGRAYFTTDGSVTTEFLGEEQEDADTWIAGYVVDGIPNVSLMATRYTLGSAGVIVHDIAYLDDNIREVVEISALNMFVSYPDLESGATYWSLTAFAGADEFIGNRFIDIIKAGPGNDVVYGRQGSDTLYGESGHDWLDGGAGIDTLYGGYGDDTYVVDQVADRVLEAAGAGIDLVRSSVSLRLAANVEKLTLIGANAWTATGNALANELRGNELDNRLDGLGGADWMAGGAGRDTYVVDNAGDVVSEAAGGGTDQIFASVTTILPSYVENLTLTGTGSTGGYGNALANVIRGNGAANAISGRGGADLMIGGRGDDSYAVDNAGDRVMEGAGEGTDTIYASVTFSLPSYNYVERMQLTGSAPIGAFGDGRANVLTGNAAGNTLSGGGGDDWLAGGAGADRLYGGAGLDHLRGQEGADRFVYRSAAEAGLGAVRDVVHDLEAGIDRIDLSLIDANALVAGDQSFTFIGANLFRGQAGEVRCQYGIVAGDLDGDGVADFEIALAGHNRVSSAEFIL